MKIKQKLSYTSSHSFSRTQDWCEVQQYEGECNSLGSLYCELISSYSSNLGRVSYDAGQLGLVLFMLMVIFSLWLLLRMMILVPPAPSHGLLL